MLPFKRGFIEKCAEYGLSKAEAKTLYKSAEGIWDQIQNFAVKNQDQLINTGVGAGVGGLAGMGLAGHGNRGTGFGLGALTGGLGGWYGTPYIKDFKTGLRGLGQAGQDYIDNRDKIQQGIDDFSQAGQRFNEAGQGLGQIGQDYTDVRNSVSSLFGKGKDMLNTAWNVVTPWNWGTFGKTNSGARLA
jgi:hypothetical protein